MTQTIVAIDVSSRALRVVTMETTLRKTEIVSVETFPIQEGEDRVAALARVKEKLGPGIDSIVISTDARTVSTRALKFPFGDLRKIEPAIGFELEGQLPFDYEEAAVTWHLTERTNTSAEVLAAVSPKKALLERLAEFSAAGLEARAVVLPDACLYELVQQAGEEAVAVVSLGETTSHVVVGRNGVRLVRTLRAGGADVDRAIAKAYGIDVVEAREAKEHEGRVILGEAETPELDKLSKAVTAGLLPLVTGLATTFKTLPASDAPKKVLLTGGASRLPGLCEYLTHKLGVEVALLDLGSVAEAQGSRVQAIGPEYAMALGMALGLMRHGRGITLNFRRGAYAYQGDIQLYRGQITRIAIGVSAVILLAIFGSIVQYSMISAEEERIDRGFCDATRKIVGREICDPTAALATMRQTPGAGEGVVIPPYTAGALFEMLSKSIPGELDVKFDELEFNVDGRAGSPDRISGKGEAASFETTEQIIASLKRDPCVQEAEVSKQRKGKDGGRVEFNFSVKVSCPAGVFPGTGPEVARAAPPEPEPQPLAEDSMGDVP